MTDLVDELRALVGAAHVLTDPELRAPYEHDWTGRFHGEAGHKQPRELHR